MALAYGVVASGLVQIGGTILPIFHAAEWVQQVFVVLIAVGFPFALVLAWAFDLTSSGIQRTANVSGLRVTSRRQVWVLALVGTAVAALALSGYWFWRPWQAQTLRLTSRTAGAKSIAVLPFQNLSAEKENAFFVDGVQGQILTDLAKVADLKVIGPTSVEQYKSEVARNIPRIGQQLGVAFILQGSVQRERDRLRVSAQLIDARSDEQLWADTYDGDLSDTFAIQSRIAQSIVEQLEAQISPQEKAAIEQRPTRDLVAFDLYLQAKELIESYLDAPDPRLSFQKALRFLNEATARDPKFVLAYAYAARAHDLLYFLDLDPTPARVAQGGAAAATALQLQPDSAEAHLSMAGHIFAACAITNARRKRSRWRGPAFRTVRLFSFLPVTSNAGAASGGKRKRISTRPRNPNAVALIAHDYDAAERALSASPRDDFQEADFTFYYPRPWYEAIIARARGDYATAMKGFAAARKVFENRLTTKPEDPRTPAVLAQVDAHLGNKKLALEEARHAVDLMPVCRATLTMGCWSCKAWRRSAPGRAKKTRRSNSCASSWGCRFI